MRLISRSVRARNVWQLGGLRCQSTVEFNRHPLRLIAIPITSEKCYIYCKHSETISPLSADDNKSWSSKAIEKAKSTWNKMEKSDSKVNVKIVTGINKLLSKVPWDENSLKSIPSQDSIMRELKSELPIPIRKFEDRNLLHQKDIIASNVSIEDLIKIPIFYPSSVTSNIKIKSQLERYATEGYRLHRRNLLWCILGLPLTIPFILLPVVPNIPGFYLCYRAYCHYKAQSGALHLQYLLKDNHLDYQKMHHHSVDLYKSTTDKTVLQNLDRFLNKESTNEVILLGEDIVPEICKNFGCEELEGDLKLAIAQEKQKQNN